MRYGAHRDLRRERGNNTLPDLRSLPLLHGYLAFTSLRIPWDHPTNCATRLLKRSSPDLEQICKRLDRRAAPEVASDNADSLPASLTILRIALGMKVAQSWTLCGDALPEPVGAGVKCAADERTSGKARQRSHEAHSEQPACPRRETTEAVAASLPGRQLAEASEGIRDTESVDRHLANRWGTSGTRPAHCS